ncbi:GDSL-type esterase/lipase family protein [Kitasatospora sp. NPDC091335]|uniref:GDSL-type esterase/lipase family protein n=1 Tax=Kitasatospora sp. NPDC091335 TaxID=3364085 RepID=UPI0038206B85
MPCDRPRSPALRRIPAIGCVLSLLIGLVYALTAAAPPARASVNDLGFATWNMQGSGGKWADYIKPFLHENPRITVLALQEMSSPPPSFFSLGDQTIPAAYNTAAGPAAANIVVSQSYFTIGEETFLLFWAITDTNGDPARPGRVNVGLIVRTSALPFNVTPEPMVVQPDPLGNSLPRPLIGVRLGSDVYYSAHAWSGGGNDRNNIVAGVAQRGGTGPNGQWAVAGDFNFNLLDPNQPLGWVPPAGVLRRSGEPTRSSADGQRLSELDYAVTSVPPNPGTRTARRGLQGSDHFPVQFNAPMQAAAEPVAYRLIDQAPAGGARVRTIGLGPDRRGENGTPIIAQEVAHDLGQVLESVGPTGIGGVDYSGLRAWASGKCLDVEVAAAGTAARAVVQNDCQVPAAKSQLWRLDTGYNQLVNADGLAVTLGAPVGTALTAGAPSVQSGAWGLDPVDTWRWKCAVETPAAVTTAALATASDGQTPFPPPQGGVCDPAEGAKVSMGDSYISGEAGRWAGNANSYAEGSAWGTDRAAVDCNADESTCRHDLSLVYGDTSYADKPGQACDRADSAEIHGAELTGRRYNISCSGATTAAVLSQSFKGQRPQIEELHDLAATRYVSLVVLSIGGNDLRFSEILADCAKAYLYPSVNNNGCRASQEAQFAAQLDAVKADVVKTLQAIRSTLHDSGQPDGSYDIVLQSYPNPLPSSGRYRYPQDSVNPFQKYGRYTQGGCPFLDQDTDWAHDSVIPRITALLGDAARQAGVSFLDVQDAFAGHELCATSAQQATSANTLGAPVDAAKAEWVRWVPYLSEQTKDIGWTAQGHQQEAVHPNYYGQQALAACLTKITAGLTGRPVTSRCAGAPGTSPGGLDDSSQLLAKGNRRGPVDGLPDWSKAGYRGGERLPGEAQRSKDAKCRITAQDLAATYGVRADDGTDDTDGIQRAIDHVRTDCTPNASPSRLSSIELPRGTVNVSKQLSVDASYLVIRGQGTGSAGGTRIVFSPDAATRYDTLYKGPSDPAPSRWDQDAMRYECPGKLGSIIGTGGWIWPGRGLFRVQTREVSAKHQRMCGDISKLPENRRDLFEGSVNQHWESGVEVAGTAADTAYAARQGGRTIQLKPDADMSAFRPGGYLWVGAANSLKFYQSQQIDTTAAASYLDNLHMRQQVFLISSVDGGGRTVTVDEPLEFDMPVNSVSDGSPPLPAGTVYASKVTPLKMITNVGFEDFTFTQQLDGMPANDGSTYHVDPACTVMGPNCPVHNYGNLAPEYAMHGIVFKWAADSWVRGVRGEMTGSHPIVTEVAKNLQIENNYFDGAWNKGKGGNGYLRGSRVWDSLYAFNTTRNLRHFTFQWSSSGNVAFANDFDSDLNLHGGWERRNLFDNNVVHVPFEHASKNCTVNCGGEGGVSDKGTWWPIYWSAGNKAVKWSGSSGPQNVFFNNALTKQTTARGPYLPYQPYSTRQRVYQFGSDATDPRLFKHLTSSGTAIPDWADMERLDYTGGNGVNNSYEDDGNSLFLKSFR